MLYNRSKAIAAIEAARVEFEERDYFSCNVLRAKLGAAFDRRGSDRFGFEPALVLGAYESVFANFAAYDDDAEPYLSCYFVECNGIGDDLVDSQHLRANMLALFQAMIEAGDVEGL